jgi:hypothetical protein
VLRGSRENEGLSLGELGGQRYSQQKCENGAVLKGSASRSRERSRQLSAPTVGAAGVELPRQARSLRRRRPSRGTQLDDVEIFAAPGVASASAMHGVRAPPPSCRPTPPPTRAPNEPSLVMGRSLARRARAAWMKPQARARV